MGLIFLAAQTISIFRTKLWKVVVKCEIIMFFIFGCFTNCVFLRLQHCILLITYPTNSVFSMVVCICKIHIFDQAFFLLAIVVMMTVKMSFSYFHGNLC